MYKINKTLKFKHWDHYTYKYITVGNGKDMILCAWFKVVSQKP